MKSFQELADEAFSDLLKKHGRPTDLKSALRQSGDQSGAAGNPGKNPLPPRKAGKLREQKR
jgi:hypothetical protein